MATAAIQPKKVKGVGFGDIFKDKPIKLRPRSIEVENDFLPVEKVHLTFLSDFVAMGKSLGLRPQMFLVHAFLPPPPHLNSLFCRSGLPAADFLPLSCVGQFSTTIAKYGLR
jgi:hypothetical protein